MFHKDVKPLTGKLKGFYRLRVGEFKIIFELDRTNKCIGVHIIVPSDSFKRKHLLRKNIIQFFQM